MVKHEIKTDTACRRCRYCLASILRPGDDRCAVQHRLGQAGGGVAYPTTQWMRSPAGQCGPDASLAEPVPPSPPALMLSAVA